MKKQLRVLVFTAGDYKTASSKYRAFLLGKYLTGVRPDIVWQIVEPSTKTISAMRYTDQICLALSQARELFWSPRHDVVFIQRAIYNKFIFLALLLQNILRTRPSVFDFDDAIFIHSKLKTRLLCKTSSAVIAGSHHLYEYARRYNKHVTLIPTCIKFSDYEKLKREQRGKNEVTLGWIGSGPAYIPELGFMAEVLYTLLEKGAQFKLLLIGAYNSAEIRRLFEFIPADRRSVIDYVDAKTDADLVPYFAKMDIGLMPLQNNPWNKGKCAFKAIQYMASGAPVVASPVGENIFLITDHTTGMLATTKEEWVKSLQELIGDPELRRQLGIVAQRLIHEQYSYESQCNSVGEIIDTVSHHERVA